KNILKDKILISKVKIIKIIALSKRYKRFPKFEIWSTLSNTLSSQLPVVLLSSFFNSTVTGFYSLSYRILVLPMSLIGGSIGQVFLQQSSANKNDSIFLKKLTKSTFFRLFIIGVIPISIIGIYGDYIFSFVFGENWIVAGEYAQLLSLWIFFVFIMSPLSTLFITLEKQKEFFIFNISILIARVASLVIGYYIFNSAYETVIIYSVVGTLFWIWLMLYIFRLVGISLKEVSSLFMLLPIVLGILIFSRIFIGV
ncbi:MAG: oligosaccharide flippase family protein, partial [Campylobacterota bacterium]|nr:oligosaccharide flippase family protein [Campylobacterota bacterium]